MVADRFLRTPIGTHAGRARRSSAGAVVLAAIVVLFNGTRHELAPMEDQGIVLAVTKAPQYAGVGYTTRYAEQIEKIFESIPEFDSSFMHIAGIAGGQNQMLGGAILKDWSGAALPGHRNPRSDPGRGRRHRRRNRHGRADALHCRVPAAVYLCKLRSPG